MKSLFRESLSEIMHSCYLTWQQISKNITATIDLGRRNFYVDRQPGLAGFFHVLRPALAGLFHVPTQTKNITKINPISDRVNFCTQGDAMLMKPNNIFEIKSKRPSELRKLKEQLTLKRKAEQLTEKLVQEKIAEKETIAEMFLAGPLAWPDYPDCEESDIEEGWTPLDWKNASSSGE